ncbi:MAG: phospho-N-acetylmuramoyl-pentapeptide-transferase [bacterium]|nr:phospho-N-acetylmuramoyl-pentapeptide-transferase [Bacteroidales bacterium]MDO4209040.1 phospho-N-acetylmuramoyl-pentapeptide-transferase [bacterium]MDY3355606.1 phospho-N-acetylmuramoyl-pentapeptide-transferase [Prevotella sp.]MCI6723662.1 phospho-N-acetylmuramoyl-pentapeptide-transferase [Bacteroidales bacterium]MCI7037810.1 phospho-N-acetylmuramoyl-pentapeptide-transferase [Bacteroidales bacterium]
MLYYIFRYLEQFGIQGAHLWSYISFRSLLALILSLVISVWFGEYFIKWMRRHHATETQRDRDIDPYGQQKKGVPTMGGIIILVAIIVPCLLFGRLRNIYMILMLVTTVWLGAIGFIDDYIKMKISKDGLRPIYKLAGQCVLGLVVGLTLWLSPDAVIRENVSVQKQGTEMVVHKSEPVKSTITTIPFVKDNNLDYKQLVAFCGKYKYAAGWILFVIMTTIVVTAVSNGSNLNDGMDGMSAGNAAIIGIALGILAYVSSNVGYASYFDIMYVPGSQELVIFICAFVGALIGFLWYNAYPAQIFMGDTGSLAIGGIIGVTAVIIHKELLIPVLCFVFFMESVSVLLQVRVAKYGNKRGKKLRLFKRAPIHDAFRVLPGQLAPDVKVILNWPRGCWLESKITTRFWIITILMAALAIITLKIR